MLQATVPMQHTLLDTLPASADGATTSAEKGKLGPPAVTKGVDERAVVMAKQLSGACRGAGNRQESARDDTNHVGRGRSLSLYLSQSEEQGRVVLKAGHTAVIFHLAFEDHGTPSRLLCHQILLQ